jgi:23S rRNA U2552 (ribose-2'-O)-methylase RlmE/FtsJ
MHFDPNNPLHVYFAKNQGRLVDKWFHYLDVYHRHFARFRGTDFTMVEIGIYHGGSLQMWRDYFGPRARIVGVDINPRCKSLEEPGIEIVIGDQADPRFLNQLRERLGHIDVLLDDGGHTMQQQVVTFSTLFPHVSLNGVYLCEDVHTSYWRDFGGGFRHQNTFIEVMKGLVDQLNAFCTKDPNSFAPSTFTRSVASMHFYDSMVVIEKQLRDQPERVVCGTPSFEDAWQGGQRLVDSRS